MEHHDVVLEQAFNGSIGSANNAKVDPFNRITKHDNAAIRGVLFYEIE